MEGSDFRGLEFGVNQQRKVRNNSIAQLWKQIIVRYKPSTTNIDKDSSECAAMCCTRERAQVGVFDI